MNGPDSPSRATRRQQWLERIDVALRGRGFTAAGTMALEAIADGVEHPTILNLAASARYGEGNSEEAAKLLKRARSLDPRDPHILNSLGVCLKALGRDDEAMQAYEAALRIDPAMAAAHFNRGTLLEETSDINRARAAYERATALDPNYAEPLAGLAWLDARAGDAEASRALAERALTRAPLNVLARLAIATVDLEQGKLESSWARLSELSNDESLGPVNRSIVLGLIADLRDAEGRTTEAFAAYAASNRELKAANAAQFNAPGRESALAQVERLTAWFERADPKAWREAPLARPRAADPKVHVFLVGFPRSGTTLLESVLAAHPEVVSLEEKNCLEQISEPYLASNGALQHLAEVRSGEALRQREAYWSMVRGFGVEPRGRVFIDKMPLSSVHLPVVAKIFPDARVLFARRDPRDVVLSCFRRRFGMNPSMYQLLTLEGAAAYYCAVMGLSEFYRDKLPLPQHVVRYESLVEDFEETAVAACNFLGLGWNESLRDFAAKARTRGITTPSSAQVARGLNRDGKGVWHRYAEQMLPVLPLLEPWVRRFGYE